MHRTIVPSKDTLWHAAKTLPYAPRSLGWLLYAGADWLEDKLRDDSCDSRGAGQRQRITGSSSGGTTTTSFKRNAADGDRLASRFTREEKEDLEECFVNALLSLAIDAGPMISSAAANLVRERGRCKPTGPIGSQR